MKILILGAGAVGSYFGGLLAKAGHEVTFAVRRGAVELRLNGIRAQGPRGDWSADSIHAETEPAQVQDSDVTLIGLKLYATEEAIQQWKPALARSRMVITLQNGLDSVNRITRAWGSGEMPLLLGGLAAMSGTVQGPGLLKYTSHMSSITFGGSIGRETELAEQFSAACRDAGFDATYVEDIVSAQWRKFVGLVTNAAITCLTRKPAGVCYHKPLLLDLAKRSIAEVASVARAAGANLPVSIESDTLALLQSFPTEMYASMYHDLVAGLPLEVDGLSGYLVRTGRVFGIDTPFHETAWACLEPYARGKEVQ
jgi:2-dehydropantoate 2-reductase